MPIYGQGLQILKCEVVPMQCGVISCYEMSVLHARLLSLKETPILLQAGRTRYFCCQAPYYEGSAAQLQGYMT